MLNWDMQMQGFGKVAGSRARTLTRPVPRVPTVSQASEAANEANPREVKQTEYLK
jgi:hypothetical protein